MKILGYISSFDELAEPDRRLGRKEAAYGVVSAILEHGGFDQMHFFLPFPGAMEIFNRVYEPHIRHCGVQKRLQFYHVLDLPLAMQRHDYTAIHAASIDNYLPELCHLRNRYATKPFPTTYTTHSLNYWETMVRHLYRATPGAMEFDSVFCTSTAAREYMQKALQLTADGLKMLGCSTAGYKGRFDIAPLGVRASDFSGVNREQALKALGLYEGPVTFLCLGRLTPADKYDLEPLIGAFKILSQRVDARLVLAGAGWRNYGTNLASLASEIGIGERVHLFQDFPGELKPKLLAAADVFISPSDNYQETFGISIVEAMAAGLPVIAGDFSGYRDLVVHNETGLLIPTVGASNYDLIDSTWPLSLGHVAAFEAAQRTALDFDALVAAMSELAVSSEARFRMGESGRGRVLERFDWKPVMNKWKSIWLELKEKADSAPWSERPRNILGMERSVLFGHYTSETLDDSAVFRPGALSREFLDGRWAMKSLANLMHTIHPVQVKMILEEINSMGGRASLAALTISLAEKMKAYQVEHACLWALKYGLLRRS